MAKTPMHTFKMDAQFWDAFLAKATSRGRTGAAILRAAVHLYLDEAEDNATPLDDATDHYETNMEPGRPITPAT